MKFYDTFKKVGFDPIGKLRFVQGFHGGGSIKPPLCDVEDCKARAHRMYADDDKKAFCLCAAHTNEASTSGLTE